MLTHLSRAFTSAVSKRGDKARLSILIYHRVLATPDFMSPTEPSVESFTWQMELAARNFNVLGLQQAVDHLKKGTLPPRSLCITFDDGYADNFTNALPVLQNLGLTATFFVATDFIDGGRMWNDTVIEAVRGSNCGVLDLRDLALKTFSLSTESDRRDAADSLVAALKYLSPEDRESACRTIADRSGTVLPSDLMMTRGQVAAMSDKGMSIGGHTAGHPILASLPSADARTEIRAGKEVLESITGKSVELFAYPNGQPGEDFTGEHVKMIRELGFDAAVTTCWGVASRFSDLYQLPRFTPWDNTPQKFLLRLLRNYYVRAQ